MNLPVRLERRDAAVHEAEAKLGQRIAELNRLTDEANLAVSQAYAEVEESDKTVRLYGQTILPAAESNVKSAQTYYTTGKIPFLTLIEAERNVIDLRDRSYDATADAFRRRAALERAVGGPLLRRPRRNLDCCPGAGRFFHFVPLDCSPYREGCAPWRRRVQYMSSGSHPSTSTWMVVCVT